jgi:hypothetical protein
MQAEEGVELIALGLCDHLAVVVLVVAVDHHPVEAGQIADSLGSGVVQLAQRAGPVQFLYRAAYGLIGVGKGERPLAVSHLQFDQQQTTRFAVQDGVEQPRPALDVYHAFHRIALAQISEGGRQLLDAGGLIHPDQRGQVLPQH